MMIALVGGPMIKSWKNKMSQYSYFSYVTCCYMLQDYEYNLFLEISLATSPYLAFRHFSVIYSFLARNN